MTALAGLHFDLNLSDHTVASLVHVKNKAPSWRRRSIRPKVKDLISCDNESPFRGQLFKSFSGLNSTKNLNNEGSNYI